MIDSEMIGRVPAAAHPSAQPRKFTWIVLQSLPVFLGISLLGLSRGHTVLPDAASYLAIAHGDLRHAAEPFANRVLHPLLVSLVSRALHISLDAAFFGTALFALAVFVVAVMALLYDHFGRWTFVLPAFALLLMPWLEDLHSLYYMHDMLHAALTAVFFLLLERHKPLALLALLLLFYTRESTVLLAVAAILVALSLKNFRFGAQLALVTVAGLLGLTYVGHLAIPNQHGVSSLMYMVFKIPYNFAANCLGMDLMVDTYPYYHDRTPLRVFDLPHWAIFGAIRQLGYFGFDMKAPAYTAATLLSSFGVLPAILCAEIRGRIRARFPSLSETAKVAFVYGLLCAAGVVFQGNGVFRYFSYAWPLFVIATPAWPLSQIASHGKTLLLALHLGFSWLAYFAIDRNAVPLVVTVAVGIALQVIVYHRVGGFREAAQVRE